MKDKPEFASNSKKVDLERIREERYESFDIELANQIIVDELLREFGAYIRSKRQIKKILRKGRKK